MQFGNTANVKNSNCLNQEKVWNAHLMHKYLNVLECHKGCQKDRVLKITKQSLVIIS